MRVASPAIVGAAPRSATSAYAWYVVVVLSLCHLVSFLDRTIISLVIGPIKRDLHLSDTGVGLLTGLAFVILFALLGLPLGRLADFMNRRLLILIGVVVWSAMTALCGFAMTVPMLFLARMGVGLGEASLAPAAFSIIANYMPDRNMGRAASIFTLGGAFGRTLALLAGGGLLIWLSGPGGPPLAILSGFKPWQALFLFASLPGIVVLLLLLTVREPKRAPTAGPASARSASTIVSTLRYIHRHGAGYYPHIIASCAVVTLGQAISAWTPTFMVRKFGMSPGESGYILGMIVILPSIIGGLGGGFLTDRFRSRGSIDAPARVITLSLGGVIVPGLIFTLVNDVHVMEAFLFIFLMISGMAGGAALGGIQILTPPDRRGVVNAVFLGVANLTAFGIGPAFVGALTDFVYCDEAALPYSMATALVIITGIGIAAAWGGRRGYIATAAKARATRMRLRQPFMPVKSRIAGFQREMATWRLDIHAQPAPGGANA